jgi:hypothetical protein
LSLKGAAEAAGHIHGATDDIKKDQAVVRRSYFHVLDRPLRWIYNSSGSRWGIVVGLVLTTVFVSLPALGLWPWFNGGQDLAFHLSRIEGIKEGLLSGQFPVKIEPPQLNGVGYANGIFYPDLFLYFPALLSLAGLSVGLAWNIMLVTINAACCLISYECFRRIFSSKRVGLLGALLYTAGFYRLMDIYLRAALGEHLALIFLPLVVYGLWQLYAPEADDALRSRAWIALVAGFVGIAESHLLSVEMTGIFCLVVMIVCWRRTFTKQTLICWLKVAILVIVLELHFLVPFIDYMRGSFSITDPSRKTWMIGGNGLNPLELITLIPTKLVTEWIFSFGYQTNMSIGIGEALVVGGLAGLVVLIRERRAVLHTTWVLSLLLGLAASVLATCVFPWNFLQASLGSFAGLVGNIQFPWRFLGIATVLLVVASCGVLTHFAHTGRIRLAAALSVVMAGLTCVVGAIFMFNQVSVSTPFTDEKLDYFLSSSSYGAIGGGEYLPGLINEVDQNALVSAELSTSENVTVSNYEKDYINIDFSVDNSGDEDGYVDVPLLWYKGYVATDTATGETLALGSAGSDANFVVRIAVPAGYSGSVTVRFVEPWYWRVAELASLICMILVIVHLFRHRTKGSVLLGHKKQIS